MSELKTLIDNELKLINDTVNNKGLYSSKLACTLKSIYDELITISEVMTNNMPVAYVDTEISRLYDYICELNVIGWSEGLTVHERTIILWHRHIAKKIAVGLIQATDK